MNQIFRVEKQNIYQVNHVQNELSELSEGEIRLRIDKYGLTTNNITYAVSGFKLKYWDFFPTDAPYGIIPVWGYASVVASKQDEIKVGERIYGYFPMASYCTLRPQKVNPFSFSDGAPHRQELAAVYNNYIRVAADPFHYETLEDYVPIIKPLFATSFLIYQFLKNQHFLDAEQIILTSASAKTSLGLAYMLKQNRAEDGKKIIALTSNRNVDFVKSTQYHDAVFAYEDYKAVASEKAVVIDISGNYNLLKNISELLNEKLLHIALVGLTDWKAAGRFSNIPNTQFFFAPTHYKVFYKTQGAVKANQMLNEALMQFTNDTKKMMELEFITDIEQLSKLYLEMVDGKVDPKKGYLVSIA